MSAEKEYQMESKRNETFDDGTSADDLPLNENDDDIQTPSESE